MATGKPPKDTISKNLQRVVNKFGHRVAGALYRRGEVIMADSKEHYVPVDLSTLKNSGTVHPPRRYGTGWIVDMTYGGAASAYALAVHEHPSKHSPPSWMQKLGGFTLVRNDGSSTTGVTFSPAGTGPKYLERPMMKAIPTLAHDIATDLGWEKL